MVLVVSRVHDRPSHHGTDHMVCTIVVYHQRVHVGMACK